MDAYGNNVRMKFNRTQRQGGMLMGINISARQDYSALFSSLNKSSGAVNNNFLSDYASIKNGSYGKLLRAYYSEDGSNSSVKSIASKKTTAVSDTDKKALTKLQNSTDSLKDAADALLTTGSKSVFGKEDKVTDAAYDAVSKFVNDYNSVLDASKNVSSNAVDSRVTGLINNTTSNSKMLGQVGISVGSDGRLSIDKDTFTKADVSKVKTLFQGNGSFGYQTSAQASLIGYSAEREASKTNTYSGNGTYNSFQTGNLFNSYF